MNRNTNVENMHFTANDAKPVLAEVPKRDFEYVCNECNFPNLTSSVSEDEIEQELQKSKIWYEYEMFFKSEPNDFCKIDGWYPIATDRIKNIDKVEEYISSGLLRRVSCNDR